MPKPTNLHKLACELARKDDPRGYNASVVDTETTIAALGKKLRASNPVRSLEIVLAIWSRAGTRKK